MFFRCRGGQVRPSRLQFQPVKIALLIAAVCALAPTGGRQAGAQRFFVPQRRPRVQRNNRPHVVRPRPAPIDQAALQLLKKMVRPSVSYSGEQVTEITTMGGNTSHQHIWGDTRGRIRREYSAPDNLSGDIMLIAPEQYRYYHRSKNSLDIALWPTEFNDREKRMFSMVQKRQVQIDRVGEEMIAGRSAAIIQLTQGGNNITKFWIDTETGVQLKNEISNRGGLISRSYLTSVALGADAGVTGKTFEIANQNAMRINPLFPKSARFDSLEAARDQLPFRPLEPGNLPNGFHLSGVWVFGVNRNRPGSGSVLLRYSDGVSTMSIFERHAAAPRNPLPNKPHKFKGSIQRWKMPLADGTTVDVTYIGHLTPDQLTALHDSLR